MALVVGLAQPAYADGKTTPTITLSFDKSTFAYGQDSMHGVVHVSDTTATGYISVRDTVANSTYGHGNLNNGVADITLDYARPTSTLTLFAEYQGDETHTNAVSNLVTITIVPGIGGPWISNATTPVNGSQFNFEVGLGDRSIQRNYSIYIDGVFWGTQAVEGGTTYPSRVFIPTLFGPSHTYDIVWAGDSSFAAHTAHLVVDGSKFGGLGWAPRYACGDVSYEGPECSISTQQWQSTSIKARLGNAEGMVMYAGATLPAGTATFFDNGQRIGDSAVKLGATDIAFTPTTSGWHTVTYAYGGDANYLPSSVGSIRVWVAPAERPANFEPADVRHGYWMTTSNGEVYAFGDAGQYGNANVPDAVDLAKTPDGNGYWIVSASGAVNPFGNAKVFGGSPTLRNGERIASLSPTVSGNGYWMFSNHGRVFTYGDALNHGDMGGARLNGPVLDSIATPSGNGYYMVASDGGVFSFGDAAFHGSMGGKRLNATVKSLVPDPDGAGYWLVAGDGGIFAFDSVFYGSMGGKHLNKPVSGMVGSTGGYLMVAEDGGIFSFGDAPFVGSLGSNPPSRAVVSVASL